MPIGRKCIDQNISDFCFNSAFCANSIFVNEYKFGLMCREDLSPNIDGMIFQYEQEQEQKGFWMYKTYFPLTIIYFDKFGNSVGLSSMEPCTRKILETKTKE